MTELSNVSVTALKGVGEAMAEKLAKVGLENVQDVLFQLVPVRVPTSSWVPMSVV